MNALRIAVLAESYNMATSYLTEISMSEQDNGNFLHRTRGSLWCKDKTIYTAETPRSLGAVRGLSSDQVIYCGGVESSLTEGVVKLIEAHILANSKVSIESNLRIQYFPEREVADQ